MATLRERQPGATWFQALLYEICRKLCHVCFHVFFRIRHVGAERVPATGSLLIASNHQSYLDPPAVGSPITQRHLSYIARAGLFRFRPFAWLITNLNSIPIREDQGDAAAIKEALRRLESGTALLIFPEGSRCGDGKIAPFKRGVALMMKKARCPVLPVAVDGAFEAWPNNRKVPRIFVRRVWVRYGAPIPYEELMKDGTDAALARIEREVRALWAEIRRERGLDP